MRPTPSTRLVAASTSTSSPRTSVFGAGFLALILSGFLAAATARDPSPSQHKREQETPPTKPSSGPSGVQSPSQADSDSKVPGDTDEPTKAHPLSPPPTLAQDKPQDAPGLHNIVAFGEGFYSGGVPEGDAAFDTLKQWGIRTIISVDGAIPDLEKAKARGIRYVHLPIGYNGFEEERKLQLTRAVRDLPKPIYLHCHHGKHRSAGAAGTVAVSLGWLDNAQALGRMGVSGTSKDYKGLYRCTERAFKLPDEVIDTAPALFPEISRPSDMVESMVFMDDAFSHLQAIEKAGWQTPQKHPDLVPAAEAGRLADLFRLLLEEHATKERPEDFQRMLRESRSFSSRIEEALLTQPIDTVALSSHLKAIQASCKECHVKYRD